MEKYILGEFLSSDSLSFKRFVKEIEETINSNDEIVLRSKECNRKFLEELRTEMESTEPEYVGTAVLDLIHKTPRYSYIKNLEFNGKKYEAEIDGLGRTFRLLEIEE